MQDPDLEKKTLNLRRGDWDFIESICRPRGIPTSVGVRTIISNYVDTNRPTSQSSLDLEADL